MPSDTDRARRSRATCPAGWLVPYRDRFLAELESLGYAPGSIWKLRQAIDLFREEVAVRGLGPGDIDAAGLAELQDAVPVPRSRREIRFRRRCVARFVDRLVADGAIAVPERPVPPDWLGRLAADYGRWLRRERGLSESTVRECRAFLRRFLAFLFGERPGDLNRIGPKEVRAFLALPPAGSGRARNLEKKAVNFRRMFRFMFATGLTRRDLVPCVPKIAARSRHGASRHLSSGEVRGLVAAVNGDGPAGRRDRAVMLLLARLGLRCQEVAAIRLDDIDWRAGEILVRGKRGFHDRMPLPVDVGEALADYVLNGRAGRSRHLFVTLRAPHRPFRTTHFIQGMLAGAFARAGVTPPKGGARAHLLRHSLAVAMLDHGNSLDEVGHVPRHRSRATTTIYARHGIEALRPLARAWPVRGEPR
ncbi:MAG: tyrosine-type recombinase/integrase [Rhodobacter sp.]|nr:tyrosine-type recombinase/integrase [Rhodobacter sp.]